jgi:hypothetical protein
LFYTEKYLSTNATKCSCPPPCKVVNYGAAVTNSYLSDNLVNSLLNGETGNNIRKRFLRAREAKTRVDYGDLKASDVIKMIEKLLKSLRRSRAVIGVDLLNKTTSTVKQLVDAVDVISQRTAADLDSFSLAVMEVVMNNDGCWLKYVTQFKEYITEIQKFDTISSSTEAFWYNVMSSMTYVEQSAESRELRDQISDFCSMTEKQKDWVKPTSSDGFCEIAQFCDEKDKHIKDANHMLFNSLDSESVSSVFTFSDFTYGWVFGIGEDENTTQPYVPYDDHEAMLQLRTEMRKKANDFREFLQKLSTSEIQKCDESIRKWKTDVKSLQEVLLSNKTSQSSWINTANELAAKIDTNIVWINDILGSFERGNITCVSSLH